MIDEIVKTIRLHLSERLTSPLLGAFSVSWVAWNYRAVIVVFSSESVLKKFEIIDTILYPTTWHGLLICLLLPLITALIYLFAYPYPAKYVYQFTRKKQREILDIRRRIEDETPLTIEDSKRLRNDLAKAEQSYYSELDRKDSELEKLKNQILLLSEAQSKTQISAPASEEPRIVKQNLSPNLIDILNLIDQANGTLSESGAIQRSELSKIETEFVLGELRRLELVSRVLDRGNNRYVYKFTHAGRAALLAARQQDSTEDDA